MASQHPMIPTQAHEQAPAFAVLARQARQFLVAGPSLVLDVTYITNGVPTTEAILTHNPNKCNHNEPTTETPS